MQRRRLLTATLELVYERGVQAVNVALISDRAGVSRKTFYDIFDDREACLLGAFEDAVARAEQAISLAVGNEGDWRGRVRAGLEALLAFLDDEPVAARLLVVDALAAGAPTLGVRKQVLTRVITTIDEGRGESKNSPDISTLTAEGVVGAVFAVIHARMLDQRSGTEQVHVVGGSEPQQLEELVGPLMALIVQPYLGSVAARQELRRRARAPKSSAPRLPSDPFKDLPIRLTYRTAQVLSSVAAAPGASSKQIADRSEVADEGQMSRLLTRLQRAGLIENCGTGPARGGANAWSLTLKGESVQAIIAEQTGQGSQRGA